jgi:hypothetical protein
MDYRVLVLALRLLLGAVVALLSGLILWFIGTVTVVPLIPHNIAVVTANLVIGIGLGTGLAGWYFGLRLGSNRRIGRYEPAVTVGSALLCAWLGQLFLSRTLFVNVDAVRVKTTNEVYGAITGALIGAMVLPLALGVWRIARREEP